MRRDSSTRRRARGTVQISSRMRSGRSTDFRCRTGSDRSGRAAASGSASRTAPPAPRGRAAGVWIAVRDRRAATSAPPLDRRRLAARRSPRWRPGRQQVVRAGPPPADTARHLRRHRPHDDVADRLRNRRVLQARRRHELARHQPVEVGRRRRVVGQHPRQHLVHRHAERVDVGREDRLAVELLGRHVGRAADDRRAVRRDLEEARRAEVGDLEHVVLGDEHVGRPQVAMDDALPVRVVDGVADLAREVERAVQIERALARRSGSRASRPARTPSR